MGAGESEIRISPGWYSSTGSRFRRGRQGGHGSRRQRRGRVEEHNLVVEGVAPTRALDGLFVGSLTAPETTRTYGKGWTRSKRLAWTPAVVAAAPGLPVAGNAVRPAVGGQDDVIDGVEVPEDRDFRRWLATRPALPTARQRTGSHCRGSRRGRDSERHQGARRIHPVLEHPERARRAEPRGHASRWKRSRSVWL